MAMETSKSKSIFEAFAIIIIAVILIPVANDLAVGANLTGSIATIVTILPLLLAVIVIVALFKDQF